MTWSSPWSQDLTYNYSVAPDTNAVYNTDDSYPVAGNYSKDGVYYYNGSKWINTPEYPMWPIISPSYQGTNPNGHGIDSKNPKYP